ncbi:MAG: T9SS type A sorting domain-containing protein, partial [Bacteroidetes bacterium]
MKRTGLLVAICLGSLMASAQTQPREAKVLFIGLDGTRSDALQQANTPTIDSLMATGISTYDSWHMGVTVSGPSWSNMLTGVWEAKHHVTNNSYSGSDYNNWPYLNNRVKELRPDLKAIQLITWNSMDDAANGTGGNVYNAMWDQSIDVGNQGQDLIMQASQIQLLDPEIDFLFAYIQDADGAGHGTGFSLTSQAYINAIEHNDQQIKKIINALRARPTYAQEEWLIVCSTDHGGLGTGHGGNSDQERSIWWFASASFLKPTVLVGSDPGSYQMTSNPVDSTLLNYVPVQVDVAVTIIDHLLPELDGDSVKNRWNLDGKSWLLPEYYDTTAYYNQPGGLPGIGLMEEAQVEATVYPNPASEVLTIDFRGTSAHKAQYKVMDVAGNIVDEGSFDPSVLFPLDVSNYNSGVYFLDMNDGENRNILRVLVN